MRRAHWLGLVASITLGVLVLAYRRAGSAEEHVPPPRVMPAFTSPSPLAPLKVSGFGDAVVALPVGATSPMPIVVAVLGIGDSPEEQCATWRDITAARAFVLCPRGAKHMVVPDAAPPEAPSTIDPATPNTADDPEGTPSEGEAPPPPPVPAPIASAVPHQEGWYPVDVATLDQEVTAGIEALRSTYGAYVAKGAIVYVGFSRGAFLGASLVAKHPDQFRRVVLIEGGQSAWQPESALAFANGGGERVLFVCGQPSCMDESAPAAERLRAQKITTRVTQGAGEGHGYKKQVKEELVRSFAWVVEGDPLWAAPIAAR